MALPVLDRELRLAYHAIQVQRGLVSTTLVVDRRAGEARRIERARLRAERRAQRKRVRQIERATQRLWELWLDA